MVFWAVFFLVFVQNENHGYNSEQGIRYLDNVVIYQKLGILFFGAKTWREGMCKKVEMIILGKKGSKLPHYEGKKHKSQLPYFETRF